MRPLYAQNASYNFLFQKIYQIYFLMPLQIIQAMIHFIEIADKNLLPLANPAERSFCVTNATATDNPIVYASPGFMKLTGYDMHDILGHNCRLLQGEDTDRNEVNNPHNPLHPSFTFILPIYIEFILNLL